ncbi:HAMP domain-containing sensor histidine kinase [Bryobacter aggregatus]|uniref:HAMP domain-containing sensor histidine kinase n=1 Tax=Bryobacter aggregatus TaxID=360054 RepID=UPI0004E25A5D|nr:HAMP domain-containing sensor histidine kinase [Bryobacter aggregatus]
MTLTTLAAQTGGDDIHIYRPVRLAEAAERSGPDFVPRLLGEEVLVTGVIAAPVLEAQDAGYLAIIDPVSGDRGLMLIFSGENKAMQPRPESLKVGTLIEARGIVSLHAGQAVVKPISIQKLGHKGAPEPIHVTPREAANFAHEGLLVKVQGEISEYREASNGDLLEFVGTGQSFRVFLPILKRSSERPLARYQRGDKVQVQGLVSQYCMTKPYNRFFQLLIASPKDIELLESRPVIPPQLVPAAVLVILLCILLAWYLQQRSSRQNRVIQRILETSEELYGANSPRELAEILRRRLLELVSGETVSVYHYNSSRKVLERLPDSVSSLPHSFHIDECATATESGIALAVRNKTMLQFTDTRAVDLLRKANEPSQSLLVIPMRSREESRGAIVITGKPRVHLLKASLHPAAQHLANDACQYLEGLDQTALREQIHRSEKLAVAGQLIHGVITELNVPLGNIRALTERLPERDALAIHEQVQKASEMVRRIVSVAKAEQIDARPVELRFLFERLVEEMDETAGELETEVNLSPDSLYILGSQDQLSKVFENLLQHARSAALFSLEKLLIVNVNRIGRSAMIELEFSGPFGEAQGPDFNEAALGLAISRGLLQSHGGEIRFRILRAGRYRYEVELPLLNSSPNEEFNEGMRPTAQRNQVTALLVEPEMQSQRRLLSIFGELNHRLIPVGNIEEAADLAEKLRFDIVFSSARPEGGTWAELFHKVHHRTPHFVLMSESADLQTEDLLDGSSSSMLRKPVEENDILNLLERLQQNSMGRSVS